MPRQIRSPQQARGLPGLVGKDRGALHLSNMLADRAEQLLGLARARQIPEGEENLNISYSRDFSDRQRFVVGPNTQARVID